MRTSGSTLDPPLSLVLTIEEVAQSSFSEYSQVVEARGLCHQIKSFSFIVSLITFDRILMCTKQLSDQLQSSSIDLSKANELVVSTKSLLSHYRSDEYWEKVYIVMHFKWQNCTILLLKYPLGKGKDQLA